MGTINYTLRPSHAVGYGGGTLSVDDTRSFDVGGALAAGSGTIAVNDADIPLVSALDSYRPLQRSGTTPTPGPPVEKIRSLRVRTTEPPTTTTVQASGPSGWEDIPLSTDSGAGQLPSGDSKRYDATRLGHFKTKLASAGSAPVNALLISDSWGEGQNSTVLLRWWQQFINKLRAAYPSGAVGGLGYVPSRYVAPSLAAPWAFTGTTVVFPTATPFFGLGARFTRMNVGAVGTRTFTGTDYDLIFATGASAGVCTYTVDGGPPTTVNCHDATLLPNNTPRVRSSGKIEPIRGLAAGAHTIVVTAVDGTTLNGAGKATLQTFLEGGHEYNGDLAKGVHQWEASHHGFRTSDMVEPASVYRYQAYGPVFPDVIIIALGINNLGTAGVDGAGSSALRTGARQAGQDVRDILAGVRAQCPGWNPSVILCVPPRRGDDITAHGSVLAPWADFDQEYRRIARNDGRITLYDMATVIGDMSDPTNPLVAPDKVHLAQAGYDALATGAFELVQAP